jgi:hypothetical protein
MLESQFAKAGDVIQLLSDRELKNSVQHTLDGLVAWTSLDSSNDRKVHSNQVFDRLPRYKAHL